MKISTFPEDWVARKQQSRLIDSAARTALFRVLEQLEQGRLVVTENDETREFGNPGSDRRSLENRRPAPDVARCADRRR